MKSRGPRPRKTLDPSRCAQLLRPARRRYVRRARSLHPRSGQESGVRRSELPYRAFHSPTGCRFRNSNCTHRVNHASRANRPLRSRCALCPRCVLRSSRAHGLRAALRFPCAPGARAETRERSEPRREREARPLARLLPAADAGASSTSKASRPAEAPNPNQTTGAAGTPRAWTPAQNSVRNRERQVRALQFPARRFRAFAIPAALEFPRARRNPILASPAQNRK